MTYKQCKTAQDHNNLIKEERLTRCGYADYAWSQSGVCISTKNGFRDNFNHTKQNTVRSNLKEQLTQGQCDALREGYIPSMQMTDTLEKLYSTEEE